MTDHTSDDDRLLSVQSFASNAYWQDVSRPPSPLQHRRRNGGNEGSQDERYLTVTATTPGALSELDDTDAVSDVEDPRGETADFTAQDKQAILGSLSISGRSLSCHAPSFGNGDNPLPATTLMTSSFSADTYRLPRASNHTGVDDVLPDLPSAPTSASSESFTSVISSRAPSTDTTAEEDATVTLSRFEQLPNEIIARILFLIRQRDPLFACMRLSRRFCHLTMALLWLNPSFASQKRLLSLLATLSRPVEQNHFTYAMFIKRLNLQPFSDIISDETISLLEQCHRLERINLATCSRLSQRSLLHAIQQWPSLDTLDLTACRNAVDDTLVQAVAQQCPGLQNVYLSFCRNLTDASLVVLADRCRKLRRITLGHCDLITDTTVQALANYCPALSEIDISYCCHLTDDALLALLPTHPRIRVLRLNSCLHLTDQGFAALPHNCDAMRAIDLTACAYITDATVQVIAERCPRLRSLDLAKCPQLTAQSIRALLPLGSSLHHLHLGHCSRITDTAIIQLTRHCTHLRYIDLACCHRITDAAVVAIAQLPRLRRLGLVRCASITDAALDALVTAESAIRKLERIHLSYCTSLSVRAVLDLMNAAPRLTHLSVTGIAAFQHPSIQTFCREPPKEFNVAQRSAFCVFSGQGVRDVRHYLNMQRYEELTQQASRYRSYMTRAESGPTAALQTNPLTSTPLLANSTANSPGDLIQLFGDLLAVSTSGTDTNAPSSSQPVSPTGQLPSNATTTEF